MEDTFNIDAIILDKIAYKENDVKLIVFSDQLGKLELVARGAKKIKSKIAGHTEPITLARIMVIRGKRVNYAGTARGQIFYPHLKNNFQRLILAGRAVKLVNDLSREGEVDSNMAAFEVLTNYLHFLETEDDLTSRILPDIFVLKFISSVGFRPNLDKVFGSSHNFDLKSGSLVQGKGKTDALCLSSQCIGYLKLILNSDFGVARALDNQPELQREIAQFISHFSSFNVPGLAQGKTS